MILGIVPTGCIGLGPFYADEEPTRIIRNKWLAVDKNIYPDYDGDRTTLGGFTLFAADAVVSLSIAYEKTILSGLNFFLIFSPPLFFF